MAVVESNPEAGQQARENDRKHVLHSWSIKSKIDPLPIARAEGRYLWDFDGKRYLDFSSQLINVNIGHQHPKLVAAIQEQAGKIAHSTMLGLTNVPAIAAEVLS